MKYFPEEYQAHVKEKRCPAHVCAAMNKGYTVDAEQCKGCGLCAKKCPSGSINLAASKASIDTSMCIRCGQCINECPFGAIKEVW